MSGGGGGGGGGGGAGAGGASASSSDIFCCFGCANFALSTVIWHFASFPERAAMLLFTNFNFSVSLTSITSVASLCQILESCYK